MALVTPGTAGMAGTAGIISDGVEVAVVVGVVVADGRVGRVVVANGVDGVVVAVGAEGVVVANCFCIPGAVSSPGGTTPEGVPCRIKPCTTPWPNSLNLAMVLGPTIPISSIPFLYCHFLTAA